MRTIKASRFGLLSVNDEDVLRFPKGIPGFYDHREWILAGEDDNPVKWLQSLHDGAIALPVMVPQAVLPGYNAKIVSGDLEELAVEDQGDLSTLVVVSIPPDAPWNMTANLRAPIVVNVKKRLARQIICANEDYGLRAFVFSESMRASFERQACQAAGETVRASDVSGEESKAGSRAASTGEENP